MKISKISGFNPILNGKKVKQENEVATKPNDLNPQQTSKLSGLYGRVLVSLGAKNAPSVVQNDYFKLPKGCQPDGFQIEAGQAISSGHDLIVDAPTGTGKTAIAQYATSKNLEEGKKTFYTTPLKALSNQKYNEFKEAYGEENVGILTGDRRENVNAPVLIMTTEVYRNMALSNMYDKPVDLMKDLQTVILDEFHYVGDVDRGSVWEESMMFTPKDVQTVALSATIGNPEELQGWFENIGKKKVDLVNIPSSARHVPLKFEQIRTASYSKQIEANQNKTTKLNGKELSKSAKPTLSDYKAVVNKLQSKEQLPAIFFVFSKKFSKNLINYFAETADDLTTKEEKQQINDIISKYQEKSYIGSNLNIGALKKGYAVHNSGIMPEQKALIEELFQKKLVKVVVATETLAAGINMPAKTVVISNPFKPTDSTIEDETAVRQLTSNEFHQMAGRAGRRGIDTEGYVYTMASNSDIAGIFSELEHTECEDLESQLDPGYSFLAGYYDYNTEDDNLKNIYEKSFYTYSDNQEEAAQKKENLTKITDARKEVLEKRGYIQRVRNHVFAQPKADMLSVIRGYDPLTIVETISSKKLEGISPENLAMFVASIANPAEGDDAELVPENFNYIYDNESKSLNDFYKIQKKYVKTNLEKLGKNVSDFNNYQEILTFLNGVEAENVDTASIREKLKELAVKRDKLNIIYDKDAAYTIDSLVDAISKGETVSNVALDEYLSVVNNYKAKNGVTDISKVIEKLEKELKDVKSTSSKGSKAQSKAKKESQNLEGSLKYAKKLKYLDERLFNEKGNNFEYTKNYSQKEINREYNKLLAVYLNATAKDSLKQAVQSCIDTEKYMKTHQIDDENYYNSRKANDCVEELISNSTSIYKDELKAEKANDVKIANKIIRPGEEAANIVYEWANLNKMQSDSMSAWKQIVKNGGYNSLDEGGIYRAILQTNDLLGQFAEVAQKGYDNAETKEDRNYYASLYETISEASSLLIKEPVVLY
jgi:superfamily II RNA helicase